MYYNVFKMNSNVLQKFVYYSAVLQFFLLSVICASADDTPIETGNQIKHVGAATFQEDYGPEGRIEPVKLTLLKGMKPGSLVSFITASDNKGTVDICDDADNILFQMDVRFEKNILYLDSQVDEESGDNHPNPVVKCAKTTTVIVYQTDGYRIFVNGKTVAFFKHRSDKPVNYINIAYDKIYELFYLTTETVNKM